jgi:hypothetical protein
MNINVSEEHSVFIFRIEICRLRVGLGYTGSLQRRLPNPCRTLSDADNGGRTFLRNFGIDLQEYTLLQPERIKVITEKTYNNLSTDKCLALQSL